MRETVEARIDRLFAMLRGGDEGVPPAWVERLPSGEFVGPDDSATPAQLEWWELFLAMDRVTCPARPEAEEDSDV